MGLVERFSKLRSRWSRNFPPNLARLMLLGCAALWGGSYLLAKFAMEAIPPQWLMGLRMIGACLCMLALFHKHIVPYLTPKIIVPARSAFLTAAYCVLTPFATWIISKNRPKAINLVAGVICLIGVGFVSLKPGGSLSLSAGDWLTIATAVIFSFNLTCLGVYTKRFDPIAVTFVQFGVAGVLFIIGALFTEPMPNASWLAPSVVASVLYLFLGATMSAQIMQNIGLAHVPASQASIIMCTESLFAVTFSALFWGETIMWSSLVGFALIFVAVLMSVIKPTKQSLHRN